MIQAGHTPQDIEMIGQDMQTSIEVMLEKFQIFDILENPNLIGEKYVVYAQCSFGQVLASREGTEFYFLSSG